MLEQIKGKKKYIAMPEDLQKQYQTWTKADIAALEQVGVDVTKFRTLKDGLAEYVDFLKAHRYY
jgi:ADP-L-glycero-D-manno-heptose 6-epimerase